MLQVVSENSPLFSKAKDSFIPIELSDAYAMMSDTQRDNVQGLYTSKDPVTITKDNATYQNGGNGIMNNEGLAVSNVLEQTGMLKQYKDKDTKALPVEATVFYNPTRGMVADSLETMVDLFGGTTGIAKQTGEFIEDVTTARNVNGSNFTLHSQGNIIAKNGIEYINSNENMGDKFLSADKFISKIEVDAKGQPKNGVPTFESFGSPVNGKDMGTLIADTGFKYMGAFTNTHDYVGQGLGGNSGFNDGVNGQASNLQMLNLIDMGRLFTGSSPHSNYNPKNWSVLDKVTGYKK